MFPTCPDHGVFDRGLRLGGEWKPMDRSEEARLEKQETRMDCLHSLGRN